jgi:hypothetical protein
MSTMNKLLYPLTLGLLASGMILIPMSYAEDEENISQPEEDQPKIDPKNSNTGDGVTDPEKPLAEAKEKKISDEELEKLWKQWAENEARRIAKELGLNEYLKGDYEKFIKDMTDAIMNDPNSPLAIFQPSVQQILDKYQFKNNLAQQNFEGAQNMYRALRYGIPTPEYVPPCIQ